MKVRKGFSVWAEFDKEAYPTFDDVNVLVRKTSIAFRKAKREAEAAKAAKAAKKTK